MESLPNSAAALIASQLHDERDLASLRCSCRFWNQAITGDHALWHALLATRFGAASAGAGGGGAATAGSGGGQVPAAAPAQAPAPLLTPEQRFKQLAALKRPVSGLEKIIWLDGQHLQVVTEPGSTFDRAVKVHAVCWLELAGRFLGVLPGRYHAAWRVRLQGHYLLDSATMVVRQEPAAATAAAAGAAGGGHPGALGAAAPPPPDEEQQEQQQEPVVAQTELTGEILQAIFQQKGSSWFELLSDPFDVAQPCTVNLGFQATSGNWKRGIVFDCVRLYREPLPRRSQQQPQQRQRGQLSAHARRAGDWLSQRVQSLLGL